MDESAGITVHHVFLLCLQIAILVSLSEPYLAARRAGRLGEYIAGKSWSPIRLFGDISALCLFVFHLFILTQESTSPGGLAPKIVFVFYGWTAMLAVWAIYSHKKAKRAAQEKPEV